MPIALILIGVLLMVVAFNDTMGDLAKELKADIPGFFIWAVAIAAILGLGYVPGLKTPSRWLLALVVLVIVLTNYQKILSGFTSFASTGAASTGAGAAAAPANPAAALTTTGAPPTAAQVSGTSASASSAGGTAQAATAALGGVAGAIAGPGIGAVMNFDPSSYLSPSAGFGGMGDLASMAELGAMFA